MLTRAAVDTRGCELLEGVFLAGSRALPPTCLHPTDGEHCVMLFYLLLLPSCKQWTLDAWEPLGGGGADTRFTTGML